MNASTQTRCTGLIPETTRDPLGHGELCLPGSSGLKPSRFRQPFVDTLPVFDQSVLPSCAPSAMAGAIHRRALMQGTVNPQRPSVEFLYRGARKRMGNENALTGTRFSDIAEVLSEKGFCSEHWAPYDPFAVLADPSRDCPLVAYQKAWDQRGKCIVQPIADSDIEGALLAGHGLVCGFEVDGGYHSANSKTAWHLKDHTDDWHAVQLVGWTPDGYETLGSYSETHGDRGIVLVTRDTIESGLTVYAVQWTPSQSEDIEL